VLAVPMSRQRVKPAEVRSVIGDDLREPVPVTDMMAEVSRKWDTYYILPAGASYVGDPEVLGFWRGLLGQSVIQLADLDAVCETIALTVGLGEDAISLDDGLAAVSQLIDPDTGIVVLAFQQSLGTWLLPDLVRSFRGAHPGVRFRLTQVHDEMHAPALDGGEADLEIGTMRRRDPALRVRQLAVEPLRLALPRDHKLAGRERIDLAEFRGNLGEESVEFGEFGDIGFYGEGVGADGFDCRVESFLIATGDGDFRALVVKLFCGCQAYAAVTASNDC